MKAIAIALVALTVGLTWLLRSHRESELSSEASALKKVSEGPVGVKTGKVGKTPGFRTLKLVGETSPGAEATVYAKVSGYLKTIQVDKGDDVREGQVLATIEAKETEYAYAGALADVKNKTRIAERLRALVRKRLVSQQEAEQADTNAQVARSHLKALETQLSYETIRAPFSGTVTVRYADPGALIQSAANSQASALPIVTLSDTRHLKISVFVSQKNAPLVKPGLPVEIRVDEKPDLKLNGTITRISGVLDSRTRTLLAEVDLDNSEKQLLAGSYVNVLLKVRTPALLEVPSQAVIFRGGKPHVAVVDSESRIQFKELKGVENDGKTARVHSGLEEGQTLAIGLPPFLKDGDRVLAIVPENDPARKKANPADPPSPRPEDSK